MKLLEDVRMGCLHSREINMQATDFSSIGAENNQLVAYSMARDEDMNDHAWGNLKCLQLLKHHLLFCIYFLKKHRV